MHHEEQFCEIILNLGQWFRKRCSIKDFLSGALVVILFGGAEIFPIVPSFFFKESIMGNIPVKLYGIRTEMSFKDISYLELWQPFCSEDRNHLFNFDRTHHEKQFCEIILNLDPWFKRKCRINVVLMLSSDSPVVQQSVTIWFKHILFVYFVLRTTYKDIQ